VVLQSSTRDLRRVTRDLAHELGQVAFPGGPCDVGLRDHADAASALVNNRYPPHLVLLHGNDDLTEMPIYRFRCPRLRHADANRIGHRVLTFGNDTADNVAVGDDADRLLSRVDDRILSAVVLPY